VSPLGSERGHVVNAELVCEAGSVCMRFPMAELVTGGAHRDRQSLINHTERSLDVSPWSLADDCEHSLLL